MMALSILPPISGGKSATRHLLIAGGANATITTVATVPTMATGTGTRDEADRRTTTGAEDRERQSKVVRTQNDTILVPTLALC